MIEAYANSLFLLAKEENLVEVFYNHFLTIEELYKDQSINNFLTNRFVDKTQLNKIVDLYFNDFNFYFLNFLHLLIKDNLFYSLKEIKDEFIRLYNKDNKVEIGVVYGTYLDEDNLVKLENALSNKLNKKVKLIFKKDESLLGGYRLEVGSFLYDTTYEYKLKLLKEKLKKGA